MQVHYGAACPPLAEIEAALDALPEGVVLLVADLDGTVAGLAAYGPVYPGPGLSSGLFMKDLFVAAAHRGDGIGRRLLKAVAQAAKAGGHGRVDWTADRDDGRLLDYYRSLGARPLEEKTFFRLTGDALEELAREEIRR